MEQQNINNIWVYVYSELFMPSLNVLSLCAICQTVQLAKNAAKFQNHAVLT